MIRVLVFMVFSVTAYPGNTQQIKDLNELIGANRPKQPAGSPTWHNIQNVVTSALQQFGGYEGVDGNKLRRSINGGAAMNLLLPMVGQILPGRPNSSYFQENFEVSGVTCLPVRVGFQCDFQLSREIQVGQQDMGEMRIATIGNSHTRMKHIFIRNGEAWSSPTFEKDLIQAQQQAAEQAQQAAMARSSQPYINTTAESERERQKMERDYNQLKRNWNAIRRPDNPLLPP